MKVFQIIIAIAACFLMALKVSSSHTRTPAVTHWQGATDTHVSAIN